VPLCITWLGQSGLLLAGGSMIVMVDPWLSEHAERATPPPRLDWPKEIDLILITHGHGDHLDLPGLEELSAHSKLDEIIAPEPHIAAISMTLPRIARAGVRPFSRPDRGIGLTALPAWHGVTIADGYSPMIGADGSSPHVGYSFVLGGVRIYVSGDTIADPALTAAVAALAPQIIFVPINGRDAAREARGILGNMNAAETVNFALAVGAEALVPLHHDGVGGNTSDIGELARAASGRALHVILPARTIPFTFLGNRS
jgi:L-ascorbate 6-phosphate lactonase